MLCYLLAIYADPEIEMAIGATRINTILFGPTRSGTCRPRSNDLGTRCAIQICTPLALCIRFPSYMYRRPGQGVANYFTNPAYDSLARAQNSLHAVKSQDDAWSLTLT